jgi:hypothetical protein
MNAAEKWGFSVQRHQEWLHTLTPNTRVQIRLPWDDGEVKGGKVFDAVITHVHAQHFHPKENGRFAGWSFRTEWRNDVGALFFHHFMGDGAGGPFHMLVNPEDK